MKVAELLEIRRQNWQELERLCERVRAARRSRVQAAELSRFAALYRAACADLALADAYQLPPNTVQYLHRLVGRAHNQLYRSRRFDMGTWARALLEEVPQRIFRDGHSVSPYPSGRLAAAILPGSTANGESPSRSSGFSSPRSAMNVR